MELINVLMGNAPEEEYHEVSIPVGDVPPYRGSKTEIESYWLTPPFAYVRILQEADGKLLYELHEPKVTQEEFVLLYLIAKFLAFALQLLFRFVQFVQQLLVLLLHLLKFKTLF